MSDKYAEQIKEAEMREAAFQRFMEYKRTLSPEAQQDLRTRYENDRGILKAGVIRYMRATGNLDPR